MVKIKGGYYIKARCIKNSAIANSPPYVREIWDYLLREANHKDNKYSGYTLKRGQLFRSYREIRDALSWKVGYRTERYNENQMKMGMRYLMKQLMITVAKQPRGNIITILNYDFFQNPKNYEATDETTSETTNGQPMGNQCVLSINKNNKNIKNDKNVKKGIVEQKTQLNIPYQEIIEYLNQKANKYFKHTSKETQSFIKARWNQGFRLDAFKFVIDIKCKKWLTEPKMIDYLRPQTLFGTKFESYLNETTHPLHGKVSDKTIQSIEALNEWEQKENEKQG